MGKFKKEYDIIVIGGGVNGLTAASYLQKAGLDVVVFERRDELGTHCNTEELGIPGVRYNMHASGMMTLASPAYNDLELERFGLEMLTSSEWAYFHPFLDKSAVLFHQFSANTQYEAWKRINTHDAEVFRTLSQYLGPHWVEFMHKFFFEIPTAENLEYMIEYLGKCPVVPNGWENMTGFEVIDSMYESERIKTAVLTTGVVLEAMPWDKLTGPFGGILMPFTMVLNWCYTGRGGSHAVPHALARCFMHHGGAVMQACPVDKIIVENGEAKGVVLSKHAVYPEAEVRAKRAVISNVTPGLTFLDMVGEEYLTPEVVTAVKGIDYNQTTITCHFVLNEKPQWIQAPQFPEVSEACVFNIGIENIKDLERMGNDRPAGVLSDPPICGGGCFQGFAMADQTQAPPGLYPFHLWPNVTADPTAEGGFENWDEIREAYSDKLEALVCEHVSNFKRAKLSRLSYSPLDMYRRNASAILGCWGGGVLSPDQFYLNRPFPGCGAPRTPISKLYISQTLGAAPGATTLHPGYIAGTIAAEDLGVRNQDWWKTKALEPYKGYVEKKWGKKWNPVVD